MARRPIKRDKSGEFNNAGLPSSDPTSPIGLLRAFVHELNAKVDTTGILSTEAPVSVTTWTHEKAYKVKPIAAEEEFTFKTAKLGAKQQIIFEFEPLDPVKCIHIEIDETKAFAVLPYFQEMVLLNMMPEDGTPGLGATFNDLKTTWMALTKLRLKDEVKTVAEEKAEIMNDAYKDNPNWGIF